MKILANFLPRIISTLIFAIGKTWRIKEVGEIEFSPHYKKINGIIYAFWHSRILPAAFFYRNKNIYVLVSKSKDGEYIAKSIEMLGYRTIRGSTGIKKGGVAAFQQLKEKLLNKNDVAITPDGPLGPKQKVQNGIIYLAKETGKPIVPFSFSAKPKKVLNTWDNFIIPYPFCRGVFVWGAPIYVPQDADEKCIHEKQQELENSLNYLTYEAEKFVENIRK
jgi:lysophospholipid acyltransferase (LPLAT)-like uncharacterized protein